MMKKLIALTLAVLMAFSLCSLALADHVSCYSLGGGSCELDTMFHPNWHLQPGETYRIFSNVDGLMYANSSWVMTPADADARNEVPALLYGGKNKYRVSARWDMGGAMVKSVRWDAGQNYIYQSIWVDPPTSYVMHGAFVVELNENYTISDLKWLKGTITFTRKADKAGFDYKFVGQVANHLVIVDGYKKRADAEDDVIDASDNTLYQCSADSPGYLCFNDGRLLTCTLKMAKKEKAFMHNDESTIDAVEEKYGGGSAHIDCYNFGGTPAFQNAAQFTLQADYADQYCVYTWANGKLTPQKYEWDENNGVYKWSTRTPGSYVISDTKLV